MTSLTHWRIRDFEPGQGDPAAITADDATGGAWIDATAPGDVHRALIEVGRIADPFQGDAEADCRWVEAREWWFRTAFDGQAAGEGERLTLAFHGLDTFATVWLNGEELGRAANMFLPVAYDVTGKARPGANVLVVRFDPATAQVADREMELWPVIGDSVATTKRNFIRKAQFGWGWDWGPHLPTVGLWRPVELKVERRAVIDGVKFTTLGIDEGGASARVRVEVEAHAFAPAAKLVAHVRLSDPQGREALAREIALGEEGGAVEATLEAPQLWWTPELGGQPLYTLEVELRDGGEVLARDAKRVGVRTIALDTSPDAEEPGTDFFRFVLNGVPVFARGACWIPADSFVGALDEARYRRLIESARAANFNMLRVWGGGIYESDAFYDLCDELGLLVWQDFMFACAPYPEDDEAFVESVRLEADAQVRRLRHHPSLALWCGNNECQVIHQLMNRMGQKDDPLQGALYYDDILPAAVARLDPTTPYWPGSPTGGPSDNSMRAGDVHNWTVWHGVPPVPDDRPVGGFDRSPEAVAYTRYAEDMARFVSEYGIQASPVMETLSRRLDPADLRLDSPAFLNRIKDKPKDKVNGMLVTVTGLPETLEDYVDFTQITQAEGLKFGIEHYRRRKPHCSGSLIWQFNDCWPCISWSLLDYDGFAKASWHYVRRAYAPVMASFKALDGGDVELWATNDTLAPVRGEAEVALVDLASGEVWRETAVLDVPANASAPVWRGAAAKIAASPLRALTVRSPDDAFPANRMFFAPIKDLALPATPVEHEVEAVSAHELRVHLRSPAYAFFTHVLAPRGWTTFSDNYFDMRAGETRVVTVRNADAPLDPDAVTVRSR